MAWCNNYEEDDNSEGTDDQRNSIVITKTCPLCGHQIPCQEQQAGIHYLPGLPAGVKFDPTDQELLEHLEGKVRPDVHKLHPLINEFIPTIDGEDGICYTHPEKLPGLSRDGLIRHFFHRPSKAYTTGNRKRRKVQTNEDGSETRWHKTGKTRPVFVGRKVKGYKKILVLYTNYGKQRKPEKTNWVMHQYHIGNNEEEKEGELVVSKVFYQTQPRQCSNNGTVKELSLHAEPKGSNLKGTSNLVHEFYNPTLMSYSHQGSHNKSSTTTSHVKSNFVVHNADDSSFDLP